MTIRKRLVLALLALIMVSLGSILTGAFGDLSGVVLGDQPLFGRAAIDPTALPPPAPSETERAVDVIVDESVSATVSLRADASDPYVQAAAEGALQDSAFSFAGNVADIRVRNGDRYEPIFWSDPTVERHEDGTATVTSRGNTNPSNRLGEVRLDIGPLYYCAETCTATVKVTVPSDTHLVTAASPQSQVTDQTSASVTAKLESSRSAPSDRLQVSLDRSVSSLQASRVQLLPPETVLRWLRDLAFVSWVLLPWFLLRRAVVQSRNSSGKPDDERIRTADRGTTRPADSRGLHDVRGGPGDPDIAALPTPPKRVVDAMGVLLLLGIPILFAMSVPPLDDLLRWLQDPDRREFTNDGGSSAWSHFINAHFRTAVPAAVGLFFWWAVMAWRAPPAGKRPRRSAALAVILAVIAATAIVVLLLTQPIEYLGSPELEANRAAFALGAALVIFGLLLWAGVATRGSQTQAALAGLGGAAAALLIAVSEASFGPYSRLFGGLITALVGVAVAAAIFWVAAYASLPKHAVVWGRKPWVQVIVVVLAVAAVVPGERYETAASWLSSYDIISFAYFAPLLLRIALLAVVVGFMATSKASDWSRDMLVWLAVALMLRPDQISIGIAWSLLAGAILIRIVLLPADSSTARPLAPLGRQNTRSTIEATINSIAAQRLLRDTRASLRTKVASADLDAADAAKVDAAVAGSLQRIPEVPDSRRLDALAWAGLASPWSRALLGAAVAAILGAVFFFASMAQSFSSIEGLFGVRWWGPLLSILLNFRFPLYGLVFGFLYPRIPGRTGLAKAARFFTVLATTETLVLLVPFPGGNVTGAVVLRLIQLVALCAVLGVGSDLLALRAGGGSGRHLADLYHSNRVILWFSGLLVATATAVATAMLSTAANLLLTGLLPEPPAPPAPNSSQVSDQGP